jgi:hypothetical protein
MPSSYYSWRILKQVEFSLQIFEKYWNIKFHENPPQWESSCSKWTDRQTGRYEKDSSRSLQFCEVI